MKNYLMFLGSILLIGLSIWLFSQLNGCLEEISDFPNKVMIVFLPLIGIAVGLILLLMSWNSIQLARMTE